MADSNHDEFREELHGEHPHSYDRAEPKYWLIGGLGVVTVVLLGLITIAIQMYYEHSFEAQTYDKVLSQDSWQLQDLRRKESSELHGYSFIDKSKGTVRIPIEHAMRLVAQDAAGNSMKYPTNPYPVRTEAQLAATQPGVSQPGAAAAIAAQKQGATSSPNVQPPEKPQQSHD